MGIILGIISLLCQAGAEQYDRITDTPEKAKQREIERCEALGIDTFDVTLKKIMDDVKWRKENGIS